MGALNPNFLAATDFAAVKSGTIGAIAEWCQCLHGKAPLMRALEALAESVGAEAVAISRVSRQPDGTSRAMVHDRQPVRTGPRLERSFARAILGNYLDKARPGTTWFKSMIDGEVDPRLSGFHARRRLSELAVIPLAVTERTEAVHLKGAHALDVTNRVECLSHPRWSI